jgi:hypothetical protein
MSGEPTVQMSVTPNPNSLKFATNRVLWDGRPVTFTSPEQAFAMPLARRLLELPGVKSVFFLRDFVTVTRDPDVSWQPLAGEVETAIRAFLAEQG